MGSEEVRVNIGVTFLLIREMPHEIFQGKDQGALLMLSSQ